MFLYQALPDILLHGMNPAPLFNKKWCWASNHDLLLLLQKIKIQHFVLVP